ncbi:TPA: hypothetical protein QB387_002032 [Pasteurella multocida]|nr:hypothetical protein [Pasteurella multocida]
MISSVSAVLSGLPYTMLPLIFSPAELAAIKPTDCFVWSQATAPTPLSVSYKQYVDVGAGFEEVEDGSFTSSIVLKEAVTPYQKTWQFEIDGDASGLDIAESLLIDDEIVKIIRVDYKTNTLTVGRGCADTLPQVHAKGARAWCYLLGAGVNQTAYLPNEAVKARLLTVTPQQTQDAASAAVIQLTTRQRQARPYPPGNVKFDGILSNTITDGTGFKLTWAHRDRDIQADQLIAHTEDSTVLGAGVSYKVDLLDGDRLVRSITTTDTTFTYPDTGKVEGEQFNKITLYSVKDKLTSLYPYEFAVAAPKTGG